MQRQWIIIAPSVSVGPQNFFYYSLEQCVRSFNYASNSNFITIELPKNISLLFTTNIWFYFFCGNGVTVEGTVVFLLTEYSKWGITHLLLTTLHWHLKVQLLFSVSNLSLCFLFVSILVLQTFWTILLKMICSTSSKVLVLVLE